MGHKKKLRHPLLRASTPKRSWPSLIFKHMSWRGRWEKVLSVQATFWNPWQLVPQCSIWFRFIVSSCSRQLHWEVINLDNSLSGVDIIRDWIFFWPVELDKLCKCCQLALKVSASGSKSFCIYPTSKTWDSKTGPLSETAKGLGWEDRLWR